MANYIFKRTDSSNASIVVQPYTANGPATPAASTLYSNPLSGISAVVASTSLVLTGKGVPEYGELVQNNLIYLMEHFAGPKRPRQPVQGQIWYKNTAGADSAFPSDPSAIGLYLYSGSTWQPIVLNSSGGSGSDLDMGGAKIINVGNATAATDALNMASGDIRYLRLTGGTLTGPVSGTNLSLTGTLSVGGTTNFSGNVTFAGPATVTFNGSTEVNIGAAPTTLFHAANKKYVDDSIAAITGGPAAYLALTGGTVNGNVIIDVPPSTSGGIGGVGVPTAGSGYVNGTYAGVPLTGGTGTGAQATIVVASGGVSTVTISAAGTGYTVGDTLSAAAADLGGSGSGFSVTVTANAADTTATLRLKTGVSLLMDSGGAGIVNFGNRIVSGVATPTSTTDAANKSYVDAAIAGVGGGSGSDIHVTAGELSVGGLLTLTLSDSSTVAVTGAFAQQAHTHPDADITVYQPVAGQSYLVPAVLAAYPGVYPTPTLTQVLRQLDRAAYFSRAPIQRQVVTAAGGVATFTLPDQCQYLVNENRLSVYIDGIKQVASGRGAARVKFTQANIALFTPMGVATPGDYTFSLTIDGGSPITVTVPVAAGYTYRQLVVYINYFLQGKPDGTTGVPTSTVYDAVARMEQYNGFMILVIESKITGAGSSISVSNAPGELFPSIPTAGTPINTSITVDRSYKEVGAPSTYSTSLIFATEPTAGQVIEFIVQP